MIKGISQGGRFLTVDVSTSYQPHIPANAPGGGMVRYHTTKHTLEVSDGVSWQEISNGLATIKLNDDAISTLEWANRKMLEEIQFEALAKDHPAIKIALDNLEKARQQLDATIILSKEHDTSTS